MYNAIEIIDEVWMIPCGDLRPVGTADWLPYLPSIPTSLFDIPPSAWPIMQLRAGFLIHKLRLEFVLVDLGWTRKSRRGLDVEDILGAPSLLHRYS